ncbi:P-loop containing nucleoside triphosphate hydrolase protein [Paraphysoderma sedebokerense]|nr:P-loop containing nucleoside triphosphate hydrolase protein [Paraphysoderma sedebokerense]
MIRDHLDEYVIGQDEAKKVLSVAIFNHYSRVRHNLLLGGVPPKKNLPEESEWKPNSRSTSILSSAANQGSPICEKSNVLIAGPSGSGKTLLVKSIANVLQVPFSMNDATPMTQAGYVGEDVEGVIQRLLQVFSSLIQLLPVALPHVNTSASSRPTYSFPVSFVYYKAANYDVDLAQTGIVFIDEIDKIGRRSESANSPPTRDISGEGVQQALLRMLEGTTVTITDKNGRRRQGGDGGVVTKGDVFEVDTSQILFILSGAFVGLEEIIQERMGKKKSIGFHSSHSESTTSSSFAPFLSSTSNTSKPSGQTNPRPLSHLQPTDLITYGFIPEFVGRIPIITSVNPLTVSSLVQILTEPKNSIVSQFQELFKGYNSTVKQRLDKYYTECLEKLDRIDEIVAASNSSTPVPNLPNPSTHIQNADGITLLFTNASLTAISNYSLKNNTGARGLRSIIEKVLLESMFTAPGDEKMMGGWVIVTRESVLNAIENEVSEENGKVDDQQMKGSVVMVTKEEGYDAVRKILEKDDGVKNERDNKSEDIVEKPEKTRKKARVDDQNEGEERKAVRL